MRAVEPPMMLGIDRGRTGDGEGRDAGDGKVPHPNSPFERVP
jgi:hypothetical protein